MFAFIAAVIEAGRELQLDTGGWLDVIFTGNSVSAAGCNLYACTLAIAFRDGRLRVKPKKRTVEGWVVVTDSRTKSPDYLGEIFAFHVFDPQAVAPPLKLEDNAHIAKITWEVEE